MRAIWRVFLMVGFCGGVCPALAEKRVTATGCSNAASGVSIWTSVTINCPTVTLSKEALEQLKEALIRSGQVARAEQQGIAPSFIYRLAEQLRPGENFDVEQAKKEIEAAVAVAVKIKHEGKELSGDALLDEVRRRIAERTQAEDLKGATRAAEEGFAEWEKKEAERRAKEKKTGVALLEAALDTDLLRFDAEAAAGRVEKIVALEHEGDRKAQFEALRARQERFYVEGRDKGINFQLETAIAIARRRVALAQGPDEHGGALNDLGVTLWSLGRRESGTGTLTEAVAALREALKEQTRERVPLYWAQTQNNLGNALTNLGDRESGTGTLTEAVAAYREALKEQTRERVPLYWAQTQMNLGVTLTSLGKRENGMGALTEAAAALREALKEQTRERVPLYWAQTQNNLGNALTNLGDRESGTGTLTEAAAAYREALKEQTRERVPLEWAQTQMNLGVTLWRLGERESGTGRSRRRLRPFARR